MTSDAVVFGAAIVIVGGIVAWAVIRRRAYKPMPVQVVVPPPQKEPEAVAPPPPEYWVGVTRYEGTDPEAAEAAFVALQGETDRIVGDVEWMDGRTHIRKFKVV